ncbi:MAG: hypothetical protein ABR521_13410 [Gaiellaceae bacterium]
MSRKILVAVAGCALLAVWAGAAAGEGTKRAACTPRVIAYGGNKALVFCGPAKAAVSAAGKTYRYSNGRCERRQQYLRVDLGMRMLGPTTQPKPNYFGLSIGRTPGAPDAAVTKDGKYGGALISVVHGGVEIAPEGRGKVTLRKNRTKGLFSIKVAGKLVTGSFTC